MGIYDRDYTHEKFKSGYGGAPQMRIGLPRITPVVKWLLIINVCVFVASLIIRPLGVFIYQWCSVDATSVSRALQPWRLVTYQFLHDLAGIWHIAMNMMVLFFLGPVLERCWGGKKFLKFYLACGVAGGLFYLLLAGLGFLGKGVMVGASGAILGTLAACAILFPHFVIFLFFFPVPIRVGAVILAAVYIFFVLTRGENAGGHAAHLAGMAAGAIYVLWQPWREKLKTKTRAGRWESKLARQRAIEMELDRILKKIHTHGLGSLTRNEKKILQDATKEEQMRSKF